MLLKLFQIIYQTRKNMIKLYVLKFNVVNLVRSIHRSSYRD